MTNNYEDEVIWDENGDARIAVWFTDEELELINKCSKLAGKSVDNYVKEAAIKSANKINEEYKNE